MQERRHHRLLDFTGFQADRVLLNFPCTARFTHKDRRPRGLAALMFLRVSDCDQLAHRFRQIFLAGSVQLVVLVTAANADDGSAAPHVLAKLTEEHRRRLDEIRGDSKYRNRSLDTDLAASKATYRVTVVERPEGVKGLVHLPYRWVVERTNAWNGKYRRTSKDYERKPASSEAMIKVSNIHLMLNRLRPNPQKRQPKFKCERKPMKKAR